MQTVGVPGLSVSSLARMYDSPRMRMKFPSHGCAEEDDAGNVDASRVTGRAPVLANRAAPIGDAHRRTADRDDTDVSFSSIPRPGEVLGHAPDATVSDAEAAVAAARRAFDTHRLVDEHRAADPLPRAVPPGADRSPRRAGRADHRRGRCHPSAVRRAHSWTSRSPSCATTPSLLKTYPMTEDLGNIESRGMQHHRWVEKEAGGVVAADHRLQLSRTSSRWPSSRPRSPPAALWCSRPRRTPR